MIYAEYKRKFPFFSMALGYVYFPLLDARHAFVFLFSLFSFCIRRVRQFQGLLISDVARGGF